MVSAGLAAVAADGISTVPKAYLQFLFFDQKLRYVPPVDGQSYARVTTAAANAIHGSVNHEQLSLEYIVPEDGYMYIYVANESNNNVDVFFDDFTISQTGLHTVEATDYYPFGLVMSRYRTEKYGYGYQGQYAEEDEETGWNSFELRQYDPIIARWLSPDPYGQFSSPYLAMGNNPGMVDPDGGLAMPWIGDLSFLADLPAWTTVMSDIVINGGYDLEFGLRAGDIIRGAAFGLSWMNSIRTLDLNSQITMMQPNIDYGHGSSAQSAQTGGSNWNAGDYYSSELVTGLNTANIIRGNFEFGGAVAYQELTKGGNAVRLADKAKYTGLVKYGKVIGRAGYVTTAGVAVYELATGNDNTHTWVDVGVTVVGVGAVAVFGTVAAPVVAVGAIGYGIWSIAGGSDWIDSNWGYRPVNNGPK